MSKSNDGQEISMKKLLTCYKCYFIFLKTFQLVGNNPEIWENLTFRRYEVCQYINYNFLKRKLDASI